MPLAVLGCFQSWTNVALDICLAGLLAGEVDVAFIDAKFKHRCNLKLFEVLKKKPFFGTPSPGTLTQTQFAFACYNHGYNQFGYPVLVITKD
jgi:hypothetical protein